MKRARILNETKEVNPYKEYKRLAGEQEARATQAALKHPELTPYEALKKEEGKIAEPLVRFDDGVMEMSPVKSKTQKEKRGIYNVTFNDKEKTMLHDKNLEDVLVYEKGNRKFGAKHIFYRHIGKGKKGELNKQEVLKLGEVFRNGNIVDDSFRETGNGISYKYTWKEKGRNIQIIVEETEDGKKIISGFSDRKKEERTTRGQPSSTKSIAQKSDDVKKEVK